MKKQEFMEQLEVLLSTIPQMEREEALRYYANYFDDAGEEMEEEVIKELGTPEKVAKIIFDEIGQVQSESIPEMNTEGVNGNNTVVKEYQRTEIKKSTENRKNSINEKKDNTNIENEFPKKKMHKGRKIFMICTSIIWAPILFAIWVILLTLLVTAALVTFALVITMISCLVVGVAAIIEGLLHLFLFPAYGLCAIGGGFACISISILVLILIILLFKIVIPTIFRIFVQSYTIPFQTK
jgi:uncharacterized membrane protein